MFCTCTHSCCTCAYSVDPAGRAWSVHALRLTVVPLFYMYTRTRVRTNTLWTWLLSSCNSCYKTKASSWPKGQLHFWVPLWIKKKNKKQSNFFCLILLLFFNETDKTMDASYLNMWSSLWLPAVNSFCVSRSFISTSTRLPPANCSVHGAKQTAAEHKHTLSFHGEASDKNHPTIHEQRHLQWRQWFNLPAYLHYSIMCF